MAPSALLTTMHYAGDEATPASMADRDPTPSVAGGAAIGEALRVNGALTDLNLSGNTIGPEGGTAIGEALRENNSLSGLRLASNRIGDEVRGGAAMQPGGAASSASELSCES